MKKIALLSAAIIFCATAFAQRTIENFNKGWKFYYADTTDLKDDYKQAAYNDAKWRTLNLPHDWSVELPFGKDNPATPEGGALPGGIGWYRKTFTVPAASKGKQVSIQFDGVYRCSEVWVNGQRVGFRPNGYISFQYNITQYLKFGQSNVVAVKVDNSKQINSRWYSGSGIYRNVRLVTTNPVAVAQWGTFVTTPKVSAKEATVNIKVQLRNDGGKPAGVTVDNVLLDPKGKVVAQKSIAHVAIKDTIATVETAVNVQGPELWSIENPALYKVVTQVIKDGKIIDEYTTPIGIRSFYFDVSKGFFLNGKSMKILGVCNHHDLGCLGAAINYRALERQMENLRSFGCNAIRTSHNPPAPELLELADKMGFIIMDEAFDMWKRGKTKYDYHLYWDEWHKQDLEDQILRDRNHPSVFMWSIGNEISEQGNVAGTTIAKELCDIVRNLDTTRPLVDANNHPFPTWNYILKSNALDLVGYNYHHNLFKSFPDSFPGQKFIASETTSGLQTRGEYFFPSDSIRVWPPNRRAKGEDRNAGMNPDFTVSAYDNTRAPWSSTHEQTWKEIKKYPYLSGLFIWTGFDYLGEPTPYTWPAKSSYFGIVDLAGFPKDVYYMYQSEWTDKDVLHVFPHWNWNKGDSVDVWAYYNHADEVELFINGKSAGVKKKQGEDLHVMWRVVYEAGNIKAVSRRNGKTVLEQQINTAGAPAKIELIADRKNIKANGEDLSFLTVRVLDKDGNLVPKADNLINFTINGEAFVAGVDNGNPISHEPFKANYRKAFNGLALAIIQAKEKAGKVTVTASSNGLQSASVVLTLQ